MDEHRDRSLYDVTAINSCFQAPFPYCRQ